MAYIPNNWVDREGTTRYFETVDDDGALIFTPDYTKVTEMGTPVNADNMNHIEEGIAAGSFTKYNSETIYAKDDLVTTFADGELKVYKSLSNQNKGNALSEGGFWEEVAIGGGGGLEICDISTALYIDETKGKRRWLNGQIVAINDNTQAFLKRLKEIQLLHPSLFTTEDNWQAAKTLSDFGQVGLFVIDEQAGTIRIPAVVNIQGLFDLQNLGLTVQAGLPNIEGSLTNFYGEAPSASGALSIKISKTTLNIRQPRLNSQT